MTVKKEAGKTMFNIGDEFKITDGMENGVKIELTDDAYMILRYIRSKSYIKCVRKIRDDNPDMPITEAATLAIAEAGIVDIKNVCLPDGAEVKNTTKSKLAALNWKGDNNEDAPFRTYVITLMGDLGNFPGAGSSLTRI